MYLERSDIVNMTIKDIAEKYGVTTMAVRYWIKDGNIPTSKEKVIGVKPRIIIELKDVEDYLKSKSE